MATIITRVVGALLALVGLVLTVVGVWFAAQLGTSGTAEFTVRPGTADPVLIGPDVLNRVDADVVVTATPSDGASVWMALANPSDATAVVGGSEAPRRHRACPCATGRCSRPPGAREAAPSSALPTCGASRTTPRAR